MRQLTLIFSLFFTSYLFAQTTLYMPRNLEKAYNIGTRSLDGKPGKNYWQNYARYNINITVTPPNRNINGTETISYYNNSSDTLNNLIIKLFLNIHKPGAAREADAVEEYLTSGMKIHSVLINGKSVNWNEPEFHVTWQSLLLSSKLLPHDSVNISFDWSFELSKQSNREGVLDPTTFFLAYFYPRVAVYDDYYGWDRTNFTEGHEFYNDFNDYTLTVNVPKNFIVWSTGTLTNANEVLQPTYAARLEQSLTNDAITTIASLAEMNSKNVTSQREMNSWKWTAKNIPDMSLCISDHYVWDASSVIVDGKTGRRASVQAAYIDTAKDFYHMVEFGRHSLNWFSNNWPGVPYPYEKITIVQGQADMEYPMMVNDNTTPYLDFSRFVVEHEIAHTWFPFYMGINENRYGYMDEGWATMFEYLIGIQDLGKLRATDNFKMFRVRGWINDPSGEQDLPIITPGTAMTGIGFSNNIYGKAALSYLALKDLLGDEQFRKCLHQFINLWNGKHPTPWDFFYTFNNVSGKDMNWFWDSWYFNNGYIDLAVKEVSQKKEKLMVTLLNKGGFAVPTDLIITYEDETNESIHLNPDIWMNKKEAIITINTSNKKVKSLKIDGGIFMDADVRDNNWSSVF